MIPRDAGCRIWKCEWVFICGGMRWATHGSNRHNFRDVLLSNSSISSPFAQQSRQKSLLSIEKKIIWSWVPYGSRGRRCRGPECWWMSSVAGMSSRWDLAVLQSRSVSSRTCLPSRAESCGHTQQKVAHSHSGLTGQMCCRRLAHYRTVAQGTLTHCAHGSFVNDLWWCAIFLNFFLPLLCF